MPPNPPSKAHGFAIRNMSIRDMRIFKSEIKILAPPPMPNPGYAPVSSQENETTYFANHFRSHNSKKIMPNTALKRTFPLKIYGRA